MRYSRYGRFSYTLGSCLDRFLRAMLPYKTWKSLIWFVFTWLLTIGCLVSLVTPNWLEGGADSKGNKIRFSFLYDCKVNNTEYACNGIRTSPDPLMLLVIMGVMGLGVLSLIVLIMITLVYCFCDQLTACGRSFHTLAGFWQGIGSMLILIGIALFPLVWDHDVVTNICGPSQKFSLGNCSVGYSLWLGVACTILGYILAVFGTSLDSESFKVTSFDSMESLDTYKQSDF